MRLKDEKPKEQNGFSLRACTIDKHLSLRLKAMEMHILTG
jgi:hypothetical protein